MGWGQGLGYYFVRYSLKDGGKNFGRGKVIY